MTTYSFRVEDNYAHFTNAINETSRGECFRKMMEYATNHIEVERSYSSSETPNETFSLTFRGMEKITIKSKHNKCVITMYESEI